MPSSIVSRSCAAALLLVGVACGDDGTSSTDPSTGVGPTPTLPSTTTTDPTVTGSSGETPTTSTSGASQVMTGTDTSAGPTSASTTDLSTGSTAADDTGMSTTIPASGTDTGVMTLMSESGVVCECTPGDVDGCVGDDLNVCQDDCLVYGPEPCAGPTEKCVDGVCTALFCAPNNQVCETEDSYKVCKGDGSAYDPPVPCGPNEGCSDGQCLPLCELIKLTPSTIGCSFFANRMDNFYTNQNDSLVVGNTSKSKPASVQLYFAPNGQNVEQAQGAPVVIPPGGTTTFQLSNLGPDKVSFLRVGGAYRVQSDIPVVAYQHSPIGSQATNDASMMFPEHALQANYIISSYRQSQPSSPSYFNVIAVEPNTTVQWTPPVNTNAGAGVPAVAAGQTGMVVMNRYDTLQVVAPNPPGDLSGTLVSADKPIWVVGAVECVNVPNINTLYCDHVEEQMLPLEYWGKKYVGAHSPKRGTEKHWWRVYGGEDGTVVTTTPAQPGSPYMLNKGQWIEFSVANSTSFIFESDKAFLPVQYLEGTGSGAGTGDPAMYQMIPVEQFLDRYAFATGTTYNNHYAQIIRLAGGPDVLVDGVVVNGYYAIGEYEVADWKISEGGHLAESASPFGILNIGYTPVTSYAYPGGTRLKVINPQ